MKKITIHPWGVAMRGMLIPVLIFLFQASAIADVRLPYILSDNMVLQRDVPVNIWGWANAGEKVTVTFKDQKVSAKAAKNGNGRYSLNRSLPVALMN